MASAVLNILDFEISSSLRRQNVLRDRLNPLDEYSDGEFIARYRISLYIFMELLNEIPSKLFRSTTRSHSTQLTATLQFLATGTFQTVVASAHRISQPLFQGVSLQFVMA